MEVEDAIQLLTACSSGIKAHTLLDCTLYLTTVVESF